MSRHLLLCTLFAVLAVPASAQVSPQPETLPTPAEINQARAIADRIIDAANVRDLFTNATTGALAEVVHKASGLRCTFVGGPKDRIAVYPGRIVRGDDVSCVSRDEALDIDLNLYATRYPETPDEDEVIAITEMAIKARFPDARRYGGAMAVATVEGQPRPQAVAYHITLDGKPKLTMGLVSHKGAWSYKARATGPDENDAMMLSTYTSVLFSGAIMNTVP